MIYFAFTTLSNHPRYLPCTRNPIQSDAQQLQNEVLAFPLLYSLFLVLGGCCITLGFYHGSRYEEEDDKDKSAEPNSVDTNNVSDGSTNSKDIELVEVAGEEKKKVCCNAWRRMQSPVTMHQISTTNLK